MNRIFWELSRGELVCCTAKTVWLTGKKSLPENYQTVLSKTWTEHDGRLCFINFVIDQGCILMESEHEQQSKPHLSISSSIHYWLLLLHIMHPHCLSIQLTRSIFHGREEFIKLISTPPPSLPYFQCSRFFIPWSHSAWCFKDHRVGTYATTSLLSIESKCMTHFLTRNHWHKQIFRIEKLYTVTNKLIDRLLTNRKIWG